MNAQEMTGKFRGWQQRASEQAKNATLAADDYVRENAWTTIAIAALFGCVIGYLIARQGD